MLSVYKTYVSKASNIIHHNSAVLKLIIDSPNILHPLKVSNIPDKNGWNLYPLLLNIFQNDLHSWCGLHDVIQLT